MESVSAYEAKTHLPKLLRRVARGERFTITRHGVPVAILQPVEAVPVGDPERTIADIREFRRGNRLRGITIRELIEAGRR